MIKKITLALLISCLIVSCGKKGDPEYKINEEITKMQTILTNKI